MEIKRACGLFMALCLALPGCDRSDQGGSAAADAPDGASVARSVEEEERRLFQDFATKDATRIASHYAEDATLVIPGHAPFRGREGVSQGFGALVQDPAFAIKLANAKTHVSASGDLAYTRGTYRITYSHPVTRRPTSEEGNYVTIFRRGEDGGWKLIEDISAPGAPSL